MAMAMDSYGPNASILSNCPTTAQLGSGHVGVPPQQNLIPKVFVVSTVSKQKGSGNVPFALSYLQQCKLPP